MKLLTLIFLSIVAFSSAACATDSTASGNLMATTSPRQVTPTLLLEAPPASPTSPSTEDVPATPTSVPAIPPNPSPSPTFPLPSHTEAVPGPGVNVAGLPDPSGYTWQPVVGGLRNAVGLAYAGDGSGRLFALEKRGWIRVIQDGKLLPEPFLDITGRVGATANERGLLGLAFHPRYAENGYFYVNYTDLSGDTVIARFRITDDPKRADPDSEMKLLGVRQPFANHNGGGLAFGLDGYLYIALGDGGSGGDPQGNGQSLQTHLGKILRIDVDGGDPYAIPGGNPFGVGEGLPEIWAYGLRNPWRFSFDRLTGDIFIADVGQNQWEEIDYLPAGYPGGVNFGWNYREGSHPYQGSPPPDLELIDPVAEYDHSQGCSVTGGTVYRGSSLPDWQGVYLYGDYCSGVIWGLLRGANGAWQNERLFQVDFRITSFGEDEAGEVYLVDQGGNIYRLGQK